MNNYAGTLIRDIKIYPSSWYYNACVHGFLEILAWGLGEEGDRIIEEQILQHDGTALIPSEIQPDCPGSRFIVIFWFFKLSSIAAFK